MFLSELMSSKIGEKISCLSPTANSFKVSYNFWRDNLFERAMRLFVWKCDGIEQKEIEQRLLLNGHCGISKYKNELTAWFGSITGVTMYYDEGTTYCTHSPIDAQMLEIDKECVVISNNALRNPVYPLIHQYAMLLAHNDVTIINTLVNCRESNGIPIASTEKQRNAIQTYRNNLYKGKISAILDPAFIGVDFKALPTRQNADLKDLVEIRKNLVNSFYADLGVKTSWNKKGNMIREEVNADDSMLLLNIRDMLDSRKKACEKINRMFGVDWSVDIAEELKYSTESEESENVES